MKYLLLLLSLIGARSGRLAAQDWQPLYPGPVPNSRDVADPSYEEDRGPERGRAAHRVAVPQMAVYRPARPNGQAVIVCPGGGYGYVAYDKEGVRVAERLTREGITVVVLQYRIPQVATNPDPSLAPLMDAQQAIRHLRRHAAGYGVDPTRIGIMGFSAGGHVAALAATRFAVNADPSDKDTTSVRPDFAVLVYPVISMDTTVTHMGSRRALLGDHPDADTVRRFSADRQVSGETPPVFLVHAGDDAAVPVENSIRFYRSCLQAGVPVEAHFYPAGGHGFGLVNPTTPDNWPDRLLNWLQGR